MIGTSFAGLPAAPPPASVVSPGVLGFVVTFLMALATVGLILNMVKHLRKVRYSPDPAAAPEQPEPSEPPSGEPGR